jgi:DNA-binding NarL/FixJ family response regulator
VPTLAQARVLEALVEDGASNTELGRRLFVTAATVKWHLVVVGHHTGLRGRTAIALWWVRAPQRYRHLEAVHGERYQPTL